MYRYSRRGGSGDAVRSEMKTRLNDVVKVRGLDSLIRRASERKTDDLVRFPAETLIFCIVRLSLLAGVCDFLSFFH